MAVPNTVNTRKNVKIASIMIPVLTDTPSANIGVPRFAADAAASGYNPASREAATTAPSSCAPM
jgi:hypothetical protein